MKNILIGIFVVSVAYLAFSSADAVQSIDFRGDNYALSDQYRRSGSDVYMYSPGGENFLRAGKYIQVARLPAVDIPTEEYRRRFMETSKNFKGFEMVTANSFFYIEANNLVHSTLIQEGDGFALYGYAEIRSEEELRDLGNHGANPEIAREFEKTIAALPDPPSAISTWF